MQDPISGGWWNQNRSAPSPASAGTPNTAPVQGNPPQAAGGPAGQQTQATTPGQQPVQQAGESNADFEARIRAAEERAQHFQQEAQQARGAMQEFIQRAEQVRTENQARQVQAEFDRLRGDAIKQSRNFSPDEGAEYLERELGRIASQEREFWGLQVQQVYQQREQDRRVLGTPLFVDNLMREQGLPDAARDEIMQAAALNPDYAARIAPSIKARYDQIANIEAQLNQLSRSNTVQNLRDQGAGLVGGQTPSGGGVQKTGNADADAIAIYRAIQEGTYTS